MSQKKPVCIVGAGPAGLMAATVLAGAGYKVEIFDAMPSAGCKFLVAGRGGLNLSNAEPLASFASRYGDNASRFKGLLTDFPPDALRNWLLGLGIETYVGSSGRIFPQNAGAHDILQTWLGLLKEAGVVFHYRHRWQRFTENGTAIFLDATGEKHFVESAAVLLALGGASWPQTGSDGGWVPLLSEKGIAVLPFEPANCGIQVAWSEYFRSRFSGSPIKNLQLRFEGQQSRGDIVTTELGLEGGGIYPLSSALGRALKGSCPVLLHLDLKRDLSREKIIEKLQHKATGESLADFLRKSLRLASAGHSLLREFCSAEQLRAPESLAEAIKNLPVPVIGLSPLNEAISSVGGIAMREVDDFLMLRKLPGVFTAGEMLDWEAPTGGYLLQGAFSTGYRAGHGIINWLKRQRSSQ